MQQAIQNYSSESEFYTRLNILFKTLNDFQEEHHLDISEGLLMKLSKKIDANLSEMDMENILKKYR